MTLSGISGTCPPQSQIQGLIDKKFGSPIREGGVMRKLRCTIDCRRFANWTLNNASETEFFYSSSPALEVGKLGPELSPRFNQGGNPAKALTLQK